MHVLEVTQRHSSCCFHTNMWNLHPKGDKEQTAATSLFSSLWGETSSGVNSPSLIRWNEAGLIYTHWESTPYLTCYSSEKELSNAGTETSVTSAIWVFFAQEITLSEPIKFWGGNSCSHRRIKSIIAEDSFSQWNHPIYNSLIKVLVENIIWTSSAHIHQAEPKHEGLQFSNSTKKCNWSFWTLHRCW